MSLGALKLEIQNDPANLGYAGQTAEEVLQLLTAKTRTRKRVLSSAELVAWAAGGGRMVKIEDACINASLPPEARSIAIAAKLLLDRDGTSLDLNLSDRVAFVDGLVQAGVIGVADKETLYALATESISRLEETGIGEMHLGDVIWAMTQPGS